jgi:hypothetical protein
MELKQSPASQGASPKAEDGGQKEGRLKGEKNQGSGEEGPGFEEGGSEALAKLVEAGGEAAFLEEGLKAWKGRGESGFPEKGRGGGLPSAQREEGPRGKEDETEEPAVSFHEEKGKDETERKSEAEAVQG